MAGTVGFTHSIDTQLSIIPRLLNVQSTMEYYLPKCQILFTVPGNKSRNVNGLSDQNNHDKRISLSVE